MNKDTEVGIVEMGANHVGEINYLCSLALPTHGIITNIGRAHIGLFGGYANIIKGKTELYDFLRSNNGEVFVNASDFLLREKSNGMRSIMYGPEFHADPVVSKKTNPYLSVSWAHKIIQTKLTGEYNLDNLAAAVSIGVYFEIKKNNIIKGIENYHPKNERSEITETNNGNTIIKDYYNANRSSIEKALDNLADIETKKTKIAILGDMFELGEFAQEDHYAVMQKAISVGVEKTILVGESFSKLVHEYNHVHQFSNTDEAIFALKKMNIKNSFVLLKASQGMKFKKLFEEIDW